MRIRWGGPQTSTMRVQRSSLTHVITHECTKWDSLTEQSSGVWRDLPSYQWQVSLHVGPLSSGEHPMCLNAESAWEGA